MPVASMIATVVIEALLDYPLKSNLNTWVSSKEHIDSVKGCLTQQWSEKVGSCGFSRTYTKNWDKSESCQLCFGGNT